MCKGSEMFFFPSTADVYLCRAGRTQRGGRNSLLSYYVELNFDYFQKLLKIKNIPSHDTFSRVLRYTDFEALSGSLGEWPGRNFPEIYEKHQDKKALHLKMWRRKRSDFNGATLRLP